MQETESLPYLRETLLFLSLAGILVPLLQRLRINQVLGFLAAGVVVGPFGLGLWAEKVEWLGHFTFPHLGAVFALGELGVLFLMFMIGLELSAERLWSLRRWVFGAGTAQVLVSGLIIGLLAYWFGNNVNASLLLGLVLSLSSTAVVMQLMSEQRMLASAHGQAVFSILMLQDLAVVPLLILVGVLGSGDSNGIVGLLGLALLKSAASIALIYLLGRRVIRPLFQAILKKRQPDVFMALTLLSTLGIAGLTAAVGLSMALGAFLAGLLLAETEFRHEVEVTVEPFKGLLMGLFFMSVGMGIDVREVARNPVWIPLSVAGLFAIKAAVLSIILKLGRLSWGRAVESGLLLGQGGEFAFIVVGYALLHKLFTPEVGQFILLVVSTSLFATPLASKLGRWFAHWWQARHHEQVASLDHTTPETQSGHVVIAGFGRVGQLLAQLLSSQNVPYIAIEHDGKVVARLHPLGIPVYFGDAARPELLAKMHAGSAAAIVVTMDQPSSTLHAVKAIRREFPHVPLFARSRDEKHALSLKQAGATMVIPETLESGLQLSAFVLQSVGIPDALIAHVVQSERDQRIAALNQGAM